MMNKILLYLSWPLKDIGDFINKKECRKNNSILGGFLVMEKMNAFIALTEEEMLSIDGGDLTLAEALKAAGSVTKHVKKASSFIKKLPNPWVLGLKIGGELAGGWTVEAY